VDLIVGPPYGVIALMAVLVGTTLLFVFFDRE
jgi:hypothetical protein